MKDKINTLLDLLQGTESVIFSMCVTEHYGKIGKHRIELNLDNWYKPLFGDSWDECIDQAIEFLNNETNSESERP